MGSANKLGEARSTDRLSSIMTPFCPISGARAGFTAFAVELRCFCAEVVRDHENSRSMRVIDLCMEGSKFVQLYGCARSRRRGESDISRWPVHRPHRAA